MIAALRRRPTFEPADLLLLERTGELNYMPDEMAPHTVTADLIDSRLFVFSFEYSFDETPMKLPPSADIMITVGKYSQKVLKVAFEAPTAEDLLRMLLTTIGILRSRQRSLPKASYKKNYDLVCEQLEHFAEDIQEDPSIIPY